MWAGGGDEEFFAEGLPALFLVEVEGGGAGVAPELADGGGSLDGFLGHSQEPGADSLGTQFWVGGHSCAIARQVCLAIR